MRKIFLCIAIIAVFTRSNAQVGINSDGTLPDASAMLDVKSTTKGTLLSRMTQSQIEAITNPANGLQVYCTTNGKMYIYVSTVGQWKELAYGTGTLLPPFSCGNPITISHQSAGGVAPVDKIVTYGTANNIPGEPLKCWITSNLGSSHQATAVDDATEESAGWYWQYNLQQGYKHDGTTRTPNSAWIISVNENLDWQTTTDPCAIELQNGWRIPTYTEWINVDAGGGWTNWIGTWNSNIKLHAAGYLNNGNGSLLNRGSSGFSWSSKQYSAVNGWYLYFGSVSSVVGYILKACGFSLRCVRE